MTMNQTARNIPLDAFWMPFTANRQFKQDPRMLVSAKGVHYTSDDGRDILDGTAGLWCCNAGHGYEEIAKAAYNQLMEMDYAPAFQMGHPIAFEFADRLRALAPEEFKHVFFTGSGSESVDTALKIALAYHRARGEGQRTRLIGRERGYHGVGFGGISVGGIVNNRKNFGTMLTGVDHLPHTHLPENAFSKGQPEHGANLADDLERIVALHGAETIAAVIVEPVAGSTGVLIPPKGYLERLREITKKYGILLIFDEVITGFGRLGTPFASQRFGVVPDMFTTAKGITNGTLPMGAVFAQGFIHDAFMTGPEGMIELFHGYTYSGHPVACAAGLATLDIYERGGLLTRAAELEPYWEEKVHSLRELPNIKDIRNLGLIGGVEMESREGEFGTRAYEVFLKCFKAGAMVRYTGETIAMSPPLIFEKENIDTLIGILGEAIASTK
ncbi:aspartate aminotransferase family protein [Donghicola sp. C2-DW-16]|uniref:Aspartate aminotransferase family protein n=1 Tax=Donghicola mangrovi TaxID=2729614 RepID=A0A850Q8R5_9RHOB|nr:aspartate aminotransferase family protein [Donghicola mangrovi]NVO28520.1 aspartate aminotransferase family protein [Donghicola mangrovi]